MFEITDITSRENYIKIDFNTGESFRLTPDIFRMYSLNKGITIDRILYQQLKDESNRYLCKQKALNYIASKSRSVLEIDNYLYKKGFSRDIIREISGELKDFGYINDYDYALDYIRYRKQNKIIGLKLLKSELYKKGVSRNIINKAISESGADNADLDELYGLAQKKLQTLKDKKNIKSKLVFFLQQRGFGDKDIRNVIDGLDID